MQKKFLMLGSVFEIHPNTNCIPGMPQIEFLLSSNRYSRVFCQLRYKHPLRGYDEVILLDVRLTYPT